MSACRIMLNRFDLFCVFFSHGTHHAAKSKTLFFLPPPHSFSISGTTPAFKRCAFSAGQGCQPERLTEIHNPTNAAGVITPAGVSQPPQGTDSQLRSDALENFRASHPCHAAIWSDVCHNPCCDNGCRANKASIPDRGRSAICRPVPRRLECNPRSANAPCEIVGYPRTSARWTADEYSREISRSGVDRQNLQHRAPLTLPNRGG